MNRRPHTIAVLSGATAIFSLMVYITLWQHGAFSFSKNSAETIGLYTAVAATLFSMIHIFRDGRIDGVVASISLMLLGFKPLIDGFSFLFLEPSHGGQFAGIGILIGLGLFMIGGTCIFCATCILSRLLMKRKSEPA